MPQLHILQHKSYHPYSEKNKQRVRTDEARAAAEAAEAERARLDDSNAARLASLRRQAGSLSPEPRRRGSVNRVDRTDGADRADEGDVDNLPSTSTTREDAALRPGLLERHRLEKAREEKREKKRRERLDFDWPSETAARKQRQEQRGAERVGQVEDDGGAGGRADDGRWEKDGYLNLFADVEAQAEKPKLSMAEVVRKREKEDPHTMYLYRPDRETKPWYTDRELKRVEEKELGDEAEEKRARDRRKDARSKNRHDPLTSINTLLASHPSATPRASGPARSHASRPGQSERERALAMMAKEKGPAGFGRQWDDTPSTISGGAGGGRSWTENFERQKDRAGNRYYAETPVRKRSRVGGRSWEV